MFKFTKGHCLDDWQRKLWDAAQEEIKERIRKIHKPAKLYEETYCKTCSYEEYPASYIYPCPTIKALDGEQ
jgi:hypothetical protein